MTTVTVYLNQGPDHFFCYTPGDPLLHVVTFDVGGQRLEVDESGVPVGVLELVYQELNIDSPQEPWAIKHRLARHRSLSVGDVVVVGEVAFAVLGAGWQRVSVAANQIVAAGRSASGM